MSQQRGPRQAQGAVASSAELTQGCVGWPHCLALLPPPFLALGPVGKSYLVCLLPSANGRAVPAPHRCEEGVTFSHLTLSGQDLGSTGDTGLFGGVFGTASRHQA